VQRSGLWIVYILITSVGMVALYTIFNAGSPDSLLREFLPDPRLDVYVAMASSFVVFLLGFIVFYTRDREGFKNLVKQNGKTIRKFRKKKKSENEIADSILAAMGSEKGYKHDLARKKLLIALSEFK
jgi:hypothetical protein